MEKQARAANFERFLKMRLSGRSDVTYRAYDLLHSRSFAPLEMYLNVAGLTLPDIGAYEVFLTLQHRIVKWGYGALTVPQIKELLREYYAYYRIKVKGVNKWPYRDPEDAMRLYEENRIAMRD